MNEDTRDTFESPLDDVLRSLPEEAPPPDLERRIVNALSRDNGALRTPPKPPWTVLLKVLLPAAALFALFVAVLPALMTAGGHAFRPKEAETASAAPQMKAKMKSAAPSPLSKGAAPQMRADRRGPYGGEDERGAAGARHEVLGEERAEPEERAGDRVSPSAGFKGGPAMKAAPVAPSGAMPADVPFDHFGYDAGGNVAGLPEDFEAPAQPWRDVSGERQKVTSKRLDLEVKDVEDAYDTAKSVIEDAHGVILSEDLEVSEKQGSEAKLTARVPLDQVNGVIAQLRELGKTVKLTGDSTDKTKEYYGRGGDIRGLGSTEDELVAKYEKETDSYRKQQLYNEIQALRQQNKQDKGRLGDLSEQTHSVLLELTLTEKRGPAWFLPRALERMGTVGLWFLVTAIFWGPVALIAWAVWRRAARPQGSGQDDQP